MQKPSAPLVCTRPMVSRSGNSWSSLRERERELGDREKRRAKGREKEKRRKEEMRRQREMETERVGSKYATRPRVPSDTVTPRATLPMTVRQISPCLPLPLHPFPSLCILVCLSLPILVCCCLSLDCSQSRTNTPYLSFSPHWPLHISSTLLPLPLFLQ